MAARLWYVYGIVPGRAELGRAPTGIEDAAVSVERSANGVVGALVSTLPDDEYDAATLESRTADVEWLGPRAVAHDRLLSWASDHTPVIPLPMFTLFSSVDALHAMLAESATSFASTLARVGTNREYALRVYRVDAELLEHIGELSPRVKEMEKTTAQISPGQRYLLERKLEGERKAEVRVVSQRIATEVLDTLGAHAIAHVRSPLPRVATDAGSGVQILNAAFLVARDQYDTFQKHLSALVAEHTPHGFRFDFTGPWPAYHFVTDDTAHSPAARHRTDA